MAHALPDGSASQPSRFSETVDRLLGSRATIPSAVALLLAVLLLFGYEVRGYLSADCYGAMRGAGLDQETAALFDEVGETIAGLRKGTGNAARWSNPEFQDQLKDTQAILADGRGALRERDGFGALGAIVDLQKSIARAKSQATARVNHILGHEDPTDYDNFEKYRLEGKNLVVVVKELDAALEILANRTRELPRACNW